MRRGLTDIATMFLAVYFGWQSYLDYGWKGPVLILLLAGAGCVALWFWVVSYPTPFQRWRRWKEGA